MWMLEKIKAVLQNFFVPGKIPALRCKTQTVQEGRQQSDPHCTKHCGGRISFGAIRAIEGSTGRGSGKFL